MDACVNLEKLEGGGWGLFILIIHLSMCMPSRAARGKTRGFDISLIKSPYLGAEFLIKSGPLLSRFYS